MLKFASVLLCVGLFAACSSERVVEHKKQSLLFGTDHKALLTSYRQVMQTRRDFNHDSNWKTYGENDPDVSFPSPADPKLPNNIRRLRPALIICHDDSLDVMFQPDGSHNMGFIAYAVGVTNTPEEVSGREFQKLTNGLWFYDEIDRPLRKSQ
ncbi:MAG TPA: hypothetical protein VH597_03230 [Verrucomicrobiae bacterium]|jgi:hypothetical protein|nr:hypothetical protein [Verrucomicrobiae bacterium]